MNADMDYLQKTTPTCGEKALSFFRQHLMISSHKVAEGLPPIDHLVLERLVWRPRKDERLAVEAHKHGKMQSQR